MPRRKEPTISFHVRVPTRIFTEVQREAWKDRRSINAEMVVAFSEWLAQRKEVVRG